MILLVIRLYHVRRIETLSLAVALVAGAGVLALRAAARAGGAGRGAAAAGSTCLALVTPPVVYAAGQAGLQGLLTLAIRFTEAAPLGRLFSRRWLGLAILSGVALLPLPARGLRARGPPADPAAAPAALPTGPGERVVLLGIDGVLPEEVDYLMALGELPEMQRLAREGQGPHLSRARPTSRPPLSGRRSPPACRGRTTASPRSTASGRSG